MEGLLALPFAVPFLGVVLATVFWGRDFGAGVFLAAVFLALGLGLVIDFCLLVEGQSLDTRKNPKSNQFTYYRQFFINKNYYQTSIYEYKKNYSLFGC